MSVEAMAAVLHHSKARGTAKLVLLGIANHEGDGGAWPSIATLAVYANVTERNVQKAIDQLTGSGELAVMLQEGGTMDTPDHFRPNRYHVLVRCPSYCDRSTQHRDTRARSGDQVRAPWSLSTGVSHSTPRRRRGVSHPTPPPVSHPTPEPSITTQTHQVPAQVQNARPCAECSKPEHLCIAAQSRVAVDDRHTYRPVKR